MTAQEALQNSTATIVVLADVTAGLTITNWITSGTPGVFQRATGLRVTDFLFNLVSQPAQASMVDVAAIGGWYHDGTTLYFRHPGDLSPFLNTTQAIVSFYFSTRAKTFQNRFYDPRIAQAPSLSLRVEPTFTGVGQLGGGTLELIDADRFFEPLLDLDWDAGSVVLRLGVDLPPDRTMAFGDYVTLATWRIEEWDNSSGNFQLKLAEFKSRLSKQIPVDVYDPASYPGLGKDAAGKSIQIAYGVNLSVAPALIDAATKRFKVAGHAIKGFDRLRIKVNDIWQESAFVTRDTVLAEFTMGDDFTGNEEVAVDFTGKVDLAGNAVLNAADIVADLLQIAGETNLNAASFNLARSRLDFGTDASGNRRIIRAPSIYLDSATDVQSVISNINSLVGSYLFSDPLGQYFYGVFEPRPGEGVTTYRDPDILDYSDITDATNIPSKASSKYATRAGEGYSQLEVFERTKNQFIHGQSSAVLSEQDLAFVSQSDAAEWNQRFLVNQGSALRKYSVTVYWKGFLEVPGNLVHLVYAKRQIEEILEVLEIRTDLTQKTALLVLGNLRSLRDTSGFWVDDAAIIPARFSGLAGYGAGALAWNRNWDRSIKVWARQNVGYWTDDNGFADPLDPDSFIPSAWV